MRTVPRTDQPVRPISPRRRIALVACCALSTVGLLTGCGRGNGPTGRQADRLEIPPGALDGWNILLVTMDTLRADHVRCYGHGAIKTPVMDGLARRGVRFTQAVAPTPITLPSHASLLTGLDPPRHGARVNGLFELKPGPATLAELLTKCGYRSAAFLSSVVLDSRYRLDRGFAYYDDKWESASIVRKTDRNQRRAGPTTSAVLAWLEAHRREKFFIWLHYFDPHFPYDPPEPFASQYTSVPYDGEVAYADQQLGVVLRWLDQRQIASKTLVIVTSDHGEGLGDHDEMGHGILLHESTLHVPLIVSGPAPVPQGHTVTRLVGLIDVMPTILALVGQPIPPGLDGVNLLDPPGAGPRALYIETLASKFFRGWAPLLGIRRADYKFVLAPKPELYDLTSDPKELKNLYGSRRDVAADLYDLLKKRVGSDPELVTTVQSNLPTTPEVLQQLRALSYITSTKDPTAVTSRQAGKAFADLPNPSDLVAYVSRITAARAMIARGDHDGAIEILEPYVGKVPQDAKALVFLATCYGAKGRDADAASLLQRAAKLADGDAEGLAAVGSAYFQRKELDKAVAYFQQALEFDPKNPIALEWLGHVHRTRGRYAEAIDAFNRLLKAWDGTHGAKVHLQIGLTYQAQGRLDQAEQALSRALAIAPEYAEASEALAAVRSQQANQTIERLRRTVATQPTCESLLSLGQLLQEQGKSAEAIPYLRQALRSGGAGAETHRLLGLALESTGSRAKAVQHLRKAVELDPRSADAHLALGGALGRSGQLSEALKHFNRAAELEPRWTSARYDAGLVLAGQGKWKQAADRFREALSLDPDHLKARLRLGQMSVHLERWDEVIECCHRVLRAEPENTEARALLERAAQRAPGPAAVSGNPRK